jgi:hypothetical protein
MKEDIAMRKYRFRALSLAALLWLSAAAAFAQGAGTQGNIFGTVTDEQGEALPGATVKLTGIGAPQTFMSDARGGFRFLGLAPGSYRVEVQLEGFSPLEYPNVVVNANKNTDLEISLSAAVEDVITVTAESPLLDERRITAGTAVTSLELEKIPSARDPWSLLSQTPGVQVDRINVGGNESGQQSVFVSAGSTSDDVTWAVDGVNITDMSSISSPAYFDFDAFEEVQFFTGGSDVTKESSGVTVNVVTKRGTNEWRGSGRYMLTDGDWQSDPNVSDSDAGVTPGGTRQNLANYSPNRISEVEEYGVELGGPVVKDRLWIWGAYGTSDPIDNIVGGGQHDATILENQNLKLNAQIAATNSATAQYSTNDKLKNGRGAGATRAPETTTDQAGEGGDPTTIYKLEDTHIFNSNFYLTGLYSFVDGGFQLVPKGGVAADVWQTEDGVYRGSYYWLFNSRDVEQIKADASAFFNTGAASHELKFGASTRTSETSSDFGYAGNFWVYDCAVFGCTAGAPASTRGVDIKRDAASKDEAEYQAFWLQDTLTFGNLTANVGLRYETATGKVLPSSVPAVTRGGITFLGGVNSPGIEPGVEFETLMPRFGVTYALGGDRRTLLRASLSRFSEQFVTTNYTRLSSTGATGRLRCEFQDTNGNFIVDPGEASSIGTGPNPSCTPISYNPSNPGNFRTPSLTDTGLSPALTDELLLGVEHALAPEFVISAGVLYRLVTDIAELRPLVREAGVLRVAQRGDYIQETTVVNGQAVTSFRRRPGVTNGGGALLTNGDREQEAFGLTFGFNKRLSNRWLARGHFQYTDWTWKVPGSYFDHVDPTNFGDGARQPTNFLDPYGDRDGDAVAERSGGSGSKTGVWLNAKWSASVTGLYQVAPEQPWGFNLGGALNARQGYPNPLFASVGGGDGATRSVQLSNHIDDERNDDVYTVDVRLDKEFTFNRFGLTVSADVFNLFNDGTVLQRQRNQTSSNANFILETVSPRVARVGVRFNIN